jgi:hypothetical protein
MPRRSPSRKLLLDCLRFVHSVWKLCATRGGTAPKALARPTSLGWLLSIPWLVVFIRYSLG